MSQKKIYLILLLFSFFQTLNVSVLPFLILDISQNPNVYSFSFGLFSFGMFFGSVILGRLSDRIGRKYIVIGLIPVYSILQMWLTIIDAVSLLYIIRFLSGFALAGVTANAIPLIMENMKNSEKIIENFTIYSSLLISLGTMIGGVMSSYISRNSPLILQLGLSIILSLIMSKTIINEPIKDKIPSKGDVKISKIQWKIITINSLYILIFFFLLQGSRFILLTQMEISPALNGYISAYTGIFGLFIGRLLYPKIKKKFGDFKVLYFAYFILCIGIVFLTISMNIISIIVFLTLCIAPQNLVKIPTNIILTQNIKRNKGYIFGVNNAAISLFSALGSMLVGPGIKYLDTNSFFISFALALILYPLTISLKAKAAQT